MDSPTGLGQTIQNAIGEGSRLYNNGQQQACAALYFDCGQRILGSGLLPSDCKVVLEQAMQRATAQFQQSGGQVGQAAWCLRSALEYVMGVVAPMPSQSPMVTAQNPFVNGNSINFNSGNLGQNSAMAPPSQMSGCQGMGQNVVYDREAMTALIGKADHLTMGQNVVYDATPPVQKSIPRVSYQKQQTWTQSAEAYPPQYRDTVSCRDYSGYAGARSYEYERPCYGARRATSNDGYSGALLAGAGGLGAGALLAGAGSPGEFFSEGAAGLAGASLGSQYGTGGAVAGGLLGILTMDALF